MGKKSNKSLIDSELGDETPERNSDVLATAFASSSLRAGAQNFKHLLPLGEDLERGISIPEDESEWIPEVDLFSQPYVKHVRPRLSREHMRTLLPLVGCKVFLADKHKKIYGASATLTGFEGNQVQVYLTGMGPSTIPPDFLDLERAEKDAKKRRQILSSEGAISKKTGLENTSCYTDAYLSENRYKTIYGSKDIKERPSVLEEAREILLSDCGQHLPQGADLREALRPMLKDFDYGEGPLDLPPEFQCRIRIAPADTDLKPFKPPEEKEKTSIPLPDAVSSPDLNFSEKEKVSTSPPRDCPFLVRHYDSISRDDYLLDPIWKTNYRESLQERAGQEQINQVEDHMGLSSESLESWAQKEYPGYEPSDSDLSDDCSTCSQCEEKSSDQGTSSLEEERKKVINASSDSWSEFDEDKIFGPPTLQGLGGFPKVLLEPGKYIFSYRGGLVPFFINSESLKGICQCTGKFIITPCGCNNNHEVKIKRLITEKKDLSPGFYHFVGLPGIDLTSDYINTLCDCLSGILNQKCICDLEEKPPFQRESSNLLPCLRLDSG